MNSLEQQIATLQKDVTELINIMLPILRKNTVDCLNEIREVFEQANVKFVLTDGLVLAYGRFRGLMDWDLKDIDIGVFEPINKEKKKEIKEYFMAKGFESEQSSYRPTSCLNGFLGVQKNFIRTAVWYYEREGDYFDALALFGMAKKRWLGKWFTNPKRVQFLGHEYYIPNDMNEYLTNEYGRDWKTNIIKDMKQWEKEKKEHPKLYPYPKTVLPQERR